MSETPGRDPPEPVERRPEPTPAPPLVCPTCYKQITCMVKSYGETTTIDIMELEHPGTTRRFRVKGVTTSEQAVDAVKDLVKGCARGSGLDYGAAEDSHGVWEVNVIPQPPSSKQDEMQRRITALETALGATAIRGVELLTENNALRQDVADARVVASQILAKLEHIPCMSEDCAGVEDGEPATKDQPAPTRCHRCAAVHLARSVLM